MYHVVISATYIRHACISLSYVHNLYPCMHRKNNALWLCSVAGPGIYK